VQEFRGLSQWRRPLARGQPPTNVPGRETSEAGRPIPISGPSDGRLDPSAAAAGVADGPDDAPERLGSVSIPVTDLPVPGAGPVYLPGRLATSGASTSRGVLW